MMDFLAKRIFRAALRRRYAVRVGTVSAVFARPRAVLRVLIHFLPRVVIAEVVFVTRPRHGPVVSIDTFAAELTNPQAAPRKRKGSKTYDQQCGRSEFPNHPNQLNYPLFSP